jgi:5'-3' exonuclease
MTKLLVDADIVAYRAAYSTQDLTAEDAEEKVDEVISYILEDTTFDGGPAEFFLTGSRNFRYEIAVTAEYKGERKSSEKPTHLPHIRDYLVEQWGASVSVDQEADDDIATRATNLGEYALIASIDKDFQQVPCWHYHPWKRTITKVSEFEGLKFFYSQILTGDKIDNIIGIKGIGPVKAAKILDGCETEAELYDACVEAYGGNKDRVIENARLLWLRREEGQIWSPPK